MYNLTWGQLKEQAHNMRIGKTGSGSSGNYTLSDFNTNNWTGGVMVFIKDSLASARASTEFQLFFRKFRCYHC